MGGNNSKTENEVKKQEPQDTRTRGVESSNRRSNASFNFEEKSHAGRSELSQNGKKNEPPQEETRPSVNSRPIATESLANHQRADTSVKDELKGVRMDFPNAVKATTKPPRLAEREKPAPKRNDELAALVSPRSNNTELIAETKEKEDGITKMDYVFLLEKVKELTEGMKELNERVTHLEKQNLQPVREKENKPEGNGDIFAQLSEKPGSAEDLIRKMREQLK